MLAVALPAVQRGLRGDRGRRARARRAVRGGDPARPHARRARCPTSPRRSACSRSCCSPMRGARRGSTTPATSCRSRNRTARAGTPPRSREGLDAARRARCGAGEPGPVPGAGRDRRVSRDRGRRGRDRLGRDRRALRRAGRAWCRRRSSSSTARSRSRWPTDPTPGCALVDALDASGALAGYHLLAGDARRPAPPARATRPRPPTRTALHSRARRLRPTRNSAISPAGSPRAADRPARA